MARPPTPRWQRRHPGWAALALAACVACGGCALAEMRRTNVELSSGNAALQTRLDKERQDHEALVSNQRQLETDLARRKMTAEELAARLDELRRRNDAAAAGNEQERQSRAARSKQLAEAQGEVKAIAGDPALSPEAKARQLEETRQRVRRMLEQLLKT